MSVVLRFKLRRAILALEKCAIGRVAVSIPVGTVLTVADGFAKAAGFVNADWNGKNVQVFAVDLLIRGESIKAMSASAGGR